MVSPSLKEKKRYVAFEVISKNQVNFEKAKQEIYTTIKDFIGQLGIEKMGLMFLDDWENQKGVARVNNKFVDALKGAFVFMNAENFMIRSLKVSGTLKKIREV